MEEKKSKDTEEKKAKNPTEDKPKASIYKQEDKPSTKETIKENANKIKEKVEDSKEKKKEKEKKDTEKDSNKKEKSKKTETEKKEAQPKINIKNQDFNVSISKEMKISIVLIVALLVCLVAGVIFFGRTDETKTFSGDNNIKISMTYPKDKGYTYQQEGQAAAIVQEDENYLISIKIDKETIGYWYNGDFNKYKEGRGGSANSQDVTVNDTTGFGYYSSSTDQYEIVLPIDESETLKIDVEPIDKSKGVTGQDIYKKDEVTKIIDSIKINK